MIEKKFLAIHESWSWYSCKAQRHGLYRKGHEDLRGRARPQQTRLIDFCSSLPFRVTEAGLVDISSRRVLTTLVYNSGIWSDRNPKGWEGVWRKGKGQLHSLEFMNKSLKRKKFQNSTFSPLATLCSSALNSRLERTRRGTRGNRENSRRMLWLGRLQATNNPDENTVIGQLWQWWTIEKNSVSFKGNVKSENSI